MNIIRNILVVGDIPYLVEFISYKDMSIKEYRKFLMFRHYDVENNIVYDRNIYFIDDDTFENEYGEHVLSCTDDSYIINEEEVWPKQNAILWPSNVNNSLITYNKNPFKFCYTSDRNSLAYTICDVEGHNHNNNKDWYSLYDSKGNEILIPCDEIRIYKPHNRKNVDLIIDVTNIINDINVHYFCQLSNKQTITSEKEIKINNFVYSEYMTFYIPNMDGLFEKDKVFFNENLNIGLLNNELLIDSSTGKQLFPLYLLFEQFSIVGEGEFVQKNYIDYDDNSQYNYKNVPLNLILTYYNSYNEEIDSFEDSNYIGSGNCSIIEEHYFRICSKIGFDDDGIVSLINEFDYNDKNLSLIDAYCKYNKLNKEDYIIYNPDLGNIIDLVKKELNLDVEEGYTGNTKDIFEDLNEDDWEGIFSKVNFRKCGYYTEIATDLAFNNVIYSSQYKTFTIQDYAIPLNNIFTSWNQFPGSLFIRSIFVDKYCTQVFVGNPVVITKEHFKYFLNDSEIFKLTSLTGKNTEINTNKMNTDNFNFINNVTCVVKPNSDDTKTINNQMGSRQHILYKPIFYKVQEAQNISIRKHVTQNIGINLGDYLTKVDTFIIRFDNYEFVEMARNDVFVIFSINAMFVKENYGVYDIVNENHEYITSGNYTTF